MKKTINLISVLAIIGLVIAVQYKYFPREVVKNHYEVKDSIVYKDTTITKSIPKPYPVYIDTVKSDTVTIETFKTDSAWFRAYLSLYEKYHSKYNYLDTLKNDSSAFISIDYTLTENKPTKFKTTYFDKTPSLILEEKSSEFYIGLSGGVENISPGVLYKTKKDVIFGVEYNLVQSAVSGKVYVNPTKLW